jgi:hypothetical protein
LPAFFKARLRLGGFVSGALFQLPQVTNLFQQRGTILLESVTLRNDARFDHGHGGFLFRFLNE